MLYRYARFFPSILSKFTEQFLIFFSISPLVSKVTIGTLDFTTELIFRSFDYGCRNQFQPCVCSPFTGLILLELSFQHANTSYMMLSAIESMTD